MKSYERKIKIEIITVVAILSYYFMIRKDNTLLERGTIIAILGVWSLFALGYHIYDLKRRGLTLKQWFKEFDSRCKNKDKIVSYVFKIMKIIYIVSSIIILLVLTLGTIMIFVENKGQTNEIIVTITEVTVFSVASLESITFFFAAIIRFDENHKVA